MDPHINPASGVWDDNYYASTHPSGGGSGGAGANTQAYDDLLKGLPKTSDLVTTVNNNENSAFGDYINYLKGQSSPLDTYNQISTQQGIPQLRKTQSTLQGQIYDLEDTLRRIEPNVNATTGNSIVTEAQRQGIVNEKQKPVIENLGWLGQSLGRVSDAITQGNQQALTLTDLQQQGTQQFVDAYKTKLQLATSQGDRAIQAFMNDTNNVLNVTLAKIHRGEQVSDQEAQNAFELLKLQKTADAEIAAAKQKGNDLLTISEGTTVYDPNTGKVLYTAPKTYKPTGTGTTNVSDYYSSPWEIVP